jgi:hypothetical protein
MGGYSRTSTFHLKRGLVGSACNWTPGGEFAGRWIAYSNPSFFIR